ncbi:MAG: cytochrome c-type biogenesis protein CcmH/NrfG, partial [Polaribacter sp.]
FNYNTKNYPLSSNAWDSLAEAYKVNGNKIKARKSYIKALDLNPENPEIRKRLEELKN